MMGTKNERHSVFSVLFFQITFYCLRPWPWILVALAALILYPQLTPENAKMGYIYAMNDFLPSGLKGLLVAAFFAAYMSTIATHLNWGTSYIIHDFYRRFLATTRSEKHYVFVSRITTVLLMLASLLLTLVISSISGAWQFIIECGAGLGLVLLLRWYWWRINAWSEITATLVPALTYTAIIIYNYAFPAAPIEFPQSMFIIVSVTTMSWILVTLLTPPVDQQTLSAFYLRVRPSGFWKPLQTLHPEVKTDGGIAMRLFGWLLGVVLIYSVLFLLAEIFFGDTSGILIWAGVAGLTVPLLWYLLWRMEGNSTYDTPV
jgi:Na+/proline symporter